MENSVASAGSNGLGLGSRTLEQRCVDLRFAIRSQSVFHECPHCRSRSVWKADPYGTLEQIFHNYLKLSPYRCARCDCRFLDTKISSGDAPLPLVTRAIDRLRGWVQRTPYDTSTGLALNAIIGSASVQPERRFASIVAEPSQAQVVHSPSESALN
jgi:DNA-directed RNA polymerase subunit RPC12/RpoP